MPDHSEDPGRAASHERDPVPARADEAEPRRPAADPGEDGRVGKGSRWRWVGAPPDDHTADGEFRRRVAALAREVMLAHGADPAALPPARGHTAGPEGDAAARRGHIAGPSPVDADSLDLGSTVAFLIAVSARSVRPHVAGFESAGELEVLLATARAAAITTAHLRRSLQLPTSTLATVLNRLESAGLVERRPSPRDRRSSVVEITETGLLEAERAVAIYRRVDALLLSGLVPSERAELGRLLRKAVAVLTAPA